MGKIYFVRHGESEWNVTDQICGQTDVPLTEKGHKQAGGNRKKYCGEWDFCGSYPVFASFARKTDGTAYRRNDRNPITG